MIAVLSDIHANLEALRAVLDDAAARGVTRIFFLGDVIGYGPNPREVLDYVRRFEFCILGNHDRAVLTGPPSNFNLVAQKAIKWTRSQLHPGELKLGLFRPTERKKRNIYWEFLASRKVEHRVGEMMFMHDNPLNPGDDRYVNSMLAADDAFEKHPDIKLFFIGHSHIPAIWRPGNKEKPEFGKKYDFDTQMIINVGSVGQPRDKDPRACYVLIDDGVRFVRTEYDYKITQKKILATGLDPKLAARLAEGK